MKMEIYSFQENFKDDSDCYRWIYKKRWPNGFVCPKCKKGKDYWKVSTRNLYKCKSCNKQTSLTAGTIFHRSKIPLIKWFKLIPKLTTLEKKVSIGNLQRELEIDDYKTTKLMVNKIRQVMGDIVGKYNSFIGLVEIDKLEIFFPLKIKKRKKESLFFAVLERTNFYGTVKMDNAYALVLNRNNFSGIENILRQQLFISPSVNPSIKSIHSEAWRSYEDFRAVLPGRWFSTELIDLINKILAKKYLPEDFSPVDLSDLCLQLNQVFWGANNLKRFMKSYEIMRPIDFNVSSI